MPDLTTKVGRDELGEREWRPIDSAPKDGTRVLCGWFDHPESLEIGWYGQKLSGGGVNYGDAWGNGPRWGQRFEPQPDAWQPLPPPPARAATEET